MGINYDERDPRNWDEYGPADENAPAKCLYCREWFIVTDDNDSLPYCSPQCAINAEQDSQEDR